MNKYKIFFLYLLFSIAHCAIEKTNLSNIVKPIFDGLIISTAEVTLNQFLIYCKNRQEQQLKIFKNPRIFYRGWPANVIGSGPTTVMQLAGYDILEKKFAQKNYFYKNSMAAFFAGASSAVIASPTELLMLHQQNKGTYLSIEIKNIFNINGIGSLYRGFIPTMAIYGALTLGYLSWSNDVGAILHRHLIHNEKLANIVGGITAGIMAGVIMQPFDMIKTAMQSDLEKKHYKGMCHTLKSLLKQNNIRVLFRGIKPSISRIAIAVPLQSFLIEKLNYS